MSAGGRGPEPKDWAPEAAGFVLAGGESSRMGRDKALLQFAGRPLVEHALDIFKQAGLSASIAGARPQAHATLEAFAPVVEDARSGLGPLAGICSALAASRAQFAVFLPADLPLLPVSLIVYLLQHAATTGRAVTLVSIGGFTQTFPAVLDRTVLPALQAELTAGRGGCFSAFQAAAEGLAQPISRVAVEPAAESGHVLHPLGLPPVRWFLDLDTPEDLELAEAISRRGVA